MEHTPGPWKTYFYKGHTPTEITIGQEGSGARIASMSAGWPKADTKANAKLLAEAPRMLYALRGIIRNAGYESGKAEPSLRELSVNLEYLDSARAAIEAAS